MLIYHVLLFLFHVLLMIIEAKAYNMYKNEVFKSLRRPHLSIYLDASVDTVLSNFKKRGLGEEKTFNADFLSHLEESHRKKVLPDLERHGEVLSYDWNEPGDVEVIVEDIEKIDFDKHDRHDEKMKDWKYLDKDWDYSECRW